MEIYHLEWGDGKLINQCPAQEMLREMFWEMVQEMLWEMVGEDAKEI